MARRRARTKTHPLIVMRRSGIHGRGVYARKRIKKGTRIIEYAGERISSAEADRRSDRETEPGDFHTFLFILNRKWCIDASVHGNISRFINHQCDPNCVAWIEGDHIWIDAVKDIEKGEELGYEYEFDFEPGYTLEDLEYYKCRCGSPTCRGTMVDVPKRKWWMVRELRKRMRA